eukprot:gnl/MRDRNA2_/MRDRNA2_28054_c0_seq1.p1 gnl/MRDRNA2_/MRDRNA2_28054_c0~~gnl/MRDRNA2_/MRDRNA2_28054_c0_seq1.p1  ORF type:complete len:298 (+),score=64.26 gnl/MRDRNA2_/MRDRNA2_28054_c0_seq1:66-896(+)
MDAKDENESEEKGGSILPAAGHGAKAAGDQNSSESSYYYRYYYDGQIVGAETTETHAHKDDYEYCYHYRYYYEGEIVGSKGAQKSHSRKVTRGEIPAGASRGPGGQTGTRASGIFSPHVTLLKSSAAGRGRKSKKNTQSAKTAIVHLAAAMDTQLKGNIDFGMGVLDTLELLDMQLTDPDGYYSVQARGALCTNVGKGSQAIETIFEAENLLNNTFQKSLDGLMQGMATKTERAKIGEQESTGNSTLNKKVKAKKAKRSMNRQRIRKKTRRMNQKP